MWSACARVSASDRDPSTWQPREYGGAGIRIDTPDLLCEEQEAPQDLSVGIHEIAQPLGVLDDSLCRLSIRIQRMSRKRFEAEQTIWLTTGPSDPEERERREWIGTFHEEIVRSDTSAYAQYRYDLDCSNGDILRATADVVHVYQDGVSIHESEDEEAVRRIFGSLSCVDPAS